MDNDEKVGKCDQLIISLFKLSKFDIFQFRNMLAKFSKIDDPAEVL